MTKPNYFILVLILAGALTGCAKRGQLNGSLSAPGEPAEQVRLTFKPNVIGNGGKVSTTLPSGESFFGRYKEVASPTWSGSGPFDNPEIKGTDARFLMEKYSHEVVATLSSDAGEKMECRLTLRNPYEGLSGGGAGECQLPQEGKIELR
jgi:hypothetical protein